MANEPAAPRKSQRRSDTRQLLSNRCQMETDAHISKDISRCQSDDQIVFCLKVGTCGTPTSSAQHRYQTDIFEMLNDAGVDPLWISGEDAMLISRNDPNFFVLPVFRGKVFEHLESVGVKVVGTPMVQECLRQRIPLPKLEHPVFTFGMSGTIVCFTGLTLPRREELTRLIQWMNGVVSKPLSQSVSHLVTNRCVASNDKYKTAIKSGIPVYSTNWIDEGWMKQDMGSVTLTSPEFIAKYKLAIFANQVICTSGVSGQDRCDMGRLIELHGGKSPGEMKRGECTHLVTDRTHGEKYKKARQWGIEIVSTRWIRKCVECGYLLNERHFDPAVSVERSSTQTPNAEAPADLNFTPTIVVENSFANSEAPLPGTSRVGVEKVDKTATPVATNRSRLLRKESSRRLNITASEPDPVTQLADDCLRGDFDFLEGCLIWLCGVRDENLDKWKRLLNRCGATRVMSMDAATHVVVLAAGANKPQLEAAQRRGVVLVRAQWIVQCVHSKQQVDHHEFVWDGKEETPRSSLAPAGPAGSINDSRVGSNMEDTTRVQLSTAGTPFRNGSTVTEQKQRVAGPSPNAVGKESLFSDKTFRFYNLVPELVTQWKRKLKEHGGVALEPDDERLADCLISDYVEFNSLPSNSILRYKQVVTQLWLQRCISRSRLLDVREHALFLPIPAVFDSVVFRDIVFGFVSIASDEKAVLMELVGRFGGRTESSIVSRARNGVLPCTHLVPAVENTKVGECRRKNPKLKVVDPSWIIESLINEKLLPEVNFPLQGTAYSSYAGRTDDCWTVCGTSEDKENRPSTTSLHDLSGRVLEEGQMSEGGNMAVRTTASTSRESQASNDPNRFNPRFKLKGIGITQYLDSLPTPSPSTDSDSSLNSTTVSRIGRVLAEAAVRCARKDAPVNNAIRDGPAGTLAKSRDSANAIQDNANVAVPPAVVKDEDKPLRPIVNEEQGPSHLARALVQEELVKLVSTAEVNRSRSGSENRESSAGRSSGRKRRLQLDATETLPTRRTIDSQEGLIEWQPHTSDLCSPARAVLSVLDAEVDNADARETSVPPNVPCSTAAKSPVPISNFEPSAYAGVVADANESDTNDHDESMVCTSTTKVFTFTAIDSLEDRESMTAMIISLGGLVSKNDKPDLLEDVTHLICGKLVRGTKLMGCVASGRWVLTPEYIQSSGLSGKWLDETQFEWGDPSIVSKRNLQGRERQIALASRRWRLELTSDGSEPLTFGAFSGWRVLLYSSEEKAVALVPIITGGRGKVALRSDMQEGLASFKPTHAIVADSQAWHAGEVRELNSLNTRVFTLGYIAKYLLDEGVKCEDFYHPDYIALKRLLQYT